MGKAKKEKSNNEKAVLGKGKANNLYRNKKSKLILLTIIAAF
jgi:hypothetical protein